MRLVVFLLLAAAVPRALAINAPWYTVAATINAALKADRFVRNATSAMSATNPPVLQMSVDVAPCCTNATQPCIQNCWRAARKAKALSTMLAAAISSHNNGLGTKVNCTVTQGGAVVAPAAKPTTADAAVTELQWALVGNTYYKETAQGRSFAPGAGKRYSLIFFPRIVQFYNDDLGEFGGLSTQVAADLMEEAFQLSAWTGISSTTASCSGRPECLTPANAGGFGA